MTEGGPTEGDTDALATAVLADPELARRMYRDLANRRPGDLRARPYRLVDLAGARLSAPALPGTAAWTSALVRKRQRFLCGGWLERWTAQAVARAATGAEVRSGIHVRRGGRDVEVDVAALRGHRLYVASCTTDDSVGTAKQKAFEVMLRSRQLGGDLARSALVCLLGGTDPASARRRPELVAADVAAAWNAPNPPRVFGLGDLRAWATGHDEGLRAWLEG